MTSNNSTSIQDIHTAINTVNDPEYPGISIVDLGLLENIEINTADEVLVELIPTFSGCPALGVIAQDIEEVLRGVPGVKKVDVQWLNTPVWTVDRITAKAKEDLAENFTVAVQINERVECPRCKSMTDKKSHFGPSRCRSIHLCRNCREVIEVLRD